MKTPIAAPHFDVLIVGAGVSGIGMASHLSRECPTKTYAVLERRQDLGGTWDLFRYPGIRSDSDMYTFGYHFKPWNGAKTLADGASIKNYVRETAEEYGVLPHIHYGLKVTSANWSSREKRWSVEVLRETTGETLRYTAQFIVGCTGYYNYDAGYKPDFPGEKSFKGQVIHPQHWPDALDYSGKKVIVIGSGATAVTLVPSMAAKAAHVTMLQRSPSYMVPMPAVDPITINLQRLLPAKLVYRLTRARNITAQRLLYQTARAQPRLVRRLLLGLVRKQLRGAADMRHFTPSYNPWDERLCAVADGDLFKAIRNGKASMATGQIDSFTRNGIRLKSGEELAADIIVSATGLNIQMMGGMQVSVDGVAPKLNQTLIYKNVLVEGVPNAGMIFGYTNLPWTLKADIAAEFICRLLKQMDRKGSSVVVAHDVEGCQTADTFMGALKSGYVERANDQLPRQGRKEPWKVTQDYLRDVQTLRHESLEDGTLSFDGQVQVQKAARRHLWRWPQRASVFGA